MAQAQPSDPYGGPEVAAPAVAAPTGPQSDPYGVPAKPTDNVAIAKEVAAGPMTAATGLADTPAKVLQWIVNPSTLIPWATNTGKYIPQGSVTTASRTAVGLPARPPGYWEGIAGAASAGAVIGGVAGAITGPGAFVSAAGGALLGGTSAALIGLVPPDWQDFAGLALTATGGLLGAAARAGGPVNRTLSAGKSAQEANVAARIGAAAEDKTAATAAFTPPPPPGPPAPGVPANPTLAQKTGDVGIARAQQSLAGGTVPSQEGPVPTAAAAGFAQRAAQQEADVKAQLAGLAPQGASPGSLPAALNAPQNAAVAANDTARAGAAGQVAATSAVLPAGDTAENVGTAVRGATSDQLTSLKATEDTAWNQVRSLPAFQVDGNAVANVVKNIYGSLTPEARMAGSDAGMSGFEARLQDLTLGPADAKTGDRTGGYSGSDLGSQNLIDLTRRVGAELQNATGLEKGRLSQVYSGLLNVMDSTLAKPGLTAQQTALGAAKTATQARAAYQNSPTARPVLAVGPDKNPALAAGKIPDRVFVSGPTGRQTLAGFTSALDPAAGDALSRQLAGASLRNAAELPDGTLDPVKFVAWHDKYSDAISALPKDLQAQLSDARTAQDALGNIEAQRRDIQDSIQNATTKKIMGLSDDGDVTATVGGIFGRKDSATQMQALAGDVQKADAAAGSTDGAAGLKRSAADWLYGTFVRPSAGVQAPKLLDWLASDKNVATLRAAGFSDPQIEGLRQLSATLQTNSNLAGGLRAEGAAESAAVPAGGAKPSRWSDLLKYGAAGVGAGASSAAALASEGVLSTLATNPSLAALTSLVGPAAAAAAYALRSVKRAGINSEQRLFEETMLNPDGAAAQGVREVLTNPNSATAWRKFGIAVARGAAAAGIPSSVTATQAHQSAQ